MDNKHNLVTISPESHHLLIDLAYARPDNFTGYAIYDAPICLLHRDAAKRLLRAVEVLVPLGLKLKIWDAFRPLEAQKALFNHKPDPGYVSNPDNGTCPHCRGIAIDLTLTDSQGRELAMGTDFDDFRPIAHHGSNQVSVEVQKNRLLLAGVMNIAGFEALPNEWWHYHLPNIKQYPLLEEARVQTGIMTP